MINMLLSFLFTIVGLVLASPQDAQDNALSLIADEPSSVSATSSIQGSASSFTSPSTAALSATASSVSSVAISLTAAYSSTALDASVLSSISSTHSVAPSQLSSITTSLSTSSAPASSTATEISTPSPDLPSGVYAGIGVGATLAILAIAAITYFLIRRNRQTRKHNRINSQSQHGPPISSSPDPTGKFELQGDPGKMHGFVTTVQQKPEMYTASNRHEVEGAGVSAALTRPQPTDERHELHEDYVSYQRNGGSDTAITANDEKNGSDDRWGGGPGADSESRNGK